MTTEKQVWKFPLPVLEQDLFSISMPTGAQILTLQKQRDQLCIWALVDPSAETERRLFRIAGTGHPIAEVLGSHIGTFQMHDGTLVFHIFEVQL